MGAEERRLIAVVVRHTSYEAVSISDEISLMGAYADASVAEAEAARLKYRPARRISSVLREARESQR